MGPLETSHAAGYEVDVATPTAIVTADAGRAVAGRADGAGMTDHSTEVLVVGGGPAGLSAAIYLARYDRRCVVFDAGHGRSTHHQVNHNYLGFPGGIPAVKLLEMGRQQLAEYPHLVDFEHHKITAMRREDGGFVARGQTGEWFGRAVIYCAGVLDHYPKFRGWEAYVGRSMFWCLTCDGYASKDKNLLVVGHTDGAASEAMQLSRFSKRLTLITNSHTNEISDAHQDRLGRAGIPILHDKLKHVEGTDGMFRSIETEGGLIIELEALFCVQGATPEVKLAVECGVALCANGYIDTDEEQKTSVPGFYAAGDVTRNHSHQVSAAVHEGAQAASAANYYLYPPELKSD